MVLAFIIVGTLLAMLAIPVLGELKPDLTLDEDDIHMDTNPDEGDNVTIYATIHNIGNESAIDILVEFRDYSQKEDKWTTIGNETIRVLGAGESTNVSMVWHASPEGNHTILVRIDPENKISESDEGNNAAHKSVHVRKKGQGGTTVLKGYTRRKDNGQHISYVDITVSKVNYSESAQSDRDGWYRFEVPEGGEYDIRAHKEGYQNYSKTITVQEGKENTHHIEMEEDNQGDTTKIEGYVMEKGSRGGTPIDNATVTITNKGSNESYSTHTNGDGYYVKELAHGGNYTVTAEKDGYKSETKHAYIEEGKTTQVNFHLEKENGGGDTILKGHTKEKGSGSTIPHVQIQLSKANYSDTTESDRNGYYEFVLEEGGTYNIHAEKDGYKDYEINVSVREGEENTHNIHMEKEGGSGKTEIHGHVYEKGSRGGTPIDNASVTITNKGRNESHTVYTDSKGYYEKELTHSGNYTVTADKDGYKSETKHVYIEEGESKEVNFHLEKESGGEDTILKGYTEENDNRSRIPHVYIRVSKGNFSDTTESDSDGYYEFVLEEGGTYNIHAEKDGYKDYDANVTVNEGEVNPHHIIMEQEETNDTRIYGYIIRNNCDGTPIKDASVTIVELDCQCSYRVYSDDKGYFEKKLPEGGDHSVEVEKNGYHGQKKNITIGEGEHVRLDFSLEETGNKTVLKGYIQEKGTSDYLTDAEVTVFKGKCSETTYSNQEGYYEFQLGEGGNYTILALKKGYKSTEEYIHLRKGEQHTHHISLEMDEANVTILKGYTREATRGGYIPYVDIWISMGDLSETTQSIDNGSYKFILEEGGTYHIRAEKEGYEDYDAHVQVQEGEDNFYDIEMTKTVSKPPRILGHVKDKDTNSPLPHATVTVTGKECNCSYTDTTNENGYYEIELDLAGNYTVRVEMDGYGSQTKDSYVAEGGDSVVTFLLQKIILNTKLLGHVWEGGTRGTGVDNAKVQIDLGSNSYTVHTDRNGYYEQDLPEGGEASITISKDLYQTLQMNLTIQTGEEKRMDFYLFLENVEKPPKEKYGVDISATKTTVDLEGINLTLITITLENIGEVEDTYTLTITGSFNGWTATLDSPDNIMLEPGEIHTLSLTLAEDLTESPDGNKIIVEVTAISTTYPEVQDSVRIEGTLEEDANIPDLTIPLIAASVGLGALVASFRRRY